MDLPKTGVLPACKMIPKDFAIGHNVSLQQNIAWCAWGSPFRLQKERPASQGGSHAMRELRRHNRWPR